MAKNENRVNPIYITDPDTSEVYVLEFSRDSVRFAEQRGFKITELTDFPQTNIPAFFFYAFRMHHKSLAREKTDKLLEELGGLTPAELERLVQLYNVPNESLIVTDGGGTEKHPTDSETGREYTVGDFTESFERVFPWYLSMGMPADQFWEGDPWLAAAYREADALRNQRRSEEMWMQGLYIYNAVDTVIGNALFGKSLKYLEEPIRLRPLTEEEQAAKAEEER